MRQNFVSACTIALLLIACEPTDCSRVEKAHQSVKEGMAFHEVVATTEAAQMPDLDWIVTGEDDKLPRFEISKQPYRIRFYARPFQPGRDMSDTVPYVEHGYGTREEFLRAVVAESNAFTRHSTVRFAMHCLRGGSDIEEFTVTLSPSGTVASVSTVEHVAF